MRMFSAVIALTLIIAGMAVAQNAVRVNLTAQNEPVPAVAERITEQTGIQIAVTGNTSATLTGMLEDRTVEESVKLLADSAQASWMRAYVLELTPPDLPYSAEELLVKLNDAREDLMEAATDEQRRELVARTAPNLPEAGGERGGFAQLFEGPGGGVAAVQARGDAEGPRGGAMGSLDDPIRRLLFPGRTDEITLELAGVPVHEAVDAFTLASRFFVVIGDGVEGTVSLSVEDAPLSEVLNVIAAETGATWRTVYIFGQPRPLTDQEVAQRTEQMEQRREEIANRMWGEFWERTPEERAQWVERGVAAIERMGERMEDAAPERRQRMERFSGRIFDRLVGYSTQLSPEERLELKPVLQAMARLRAN